MKLSDRDMDALRSFLRHLAVSDVVRIMSTKTAGGGTHQDPMTGDAVAAIESLKREVYGGRVSQSPAPNPLIGNLAVRP
jgi:hypothetical protein